MRTWYDEVFDVRGQLRPAYAALASRSGRDPFHPAPTASESLRNHPFGDDVRVLPVPVALDEGEYRALTAGLVQRATALQELFVDLVLGEQRILAAGLGLDEALIGDIVAAEGTTLPYLRALWRGRGRDAVAFVHGPDLIREPGGRWMVIEDNVGCVGGTADSAAVVERYADATGIRPAVDTGPDLPVAVARWLAHHGAGPDDALVVLGCDSCAADPRSFSLEENARRRRMLRQLAVSVLTSEDFEHQAHGSPATAPVAVANLDGRAGRGSVLHQVFAAGTALLNGPGTGLLGSKALLPFVDDLIRFYCGQETLVPTPATHLLSGDGVPEPVHDWVVKRAAGHSGTEVFLLGEAPPGRRRLALDAVRTWPTDSAVAQRYVEPSRVCAGGPRAWDAWRLELRPVTYVLGEHDVYVAATPAARLASVYSDRGLNNVSQDACYAPVFREVLPSPARGA